MYENRAQFFTATILEWKLCDKPEDYRFSSASYYLCNKSEWGFISHYDESV